MTIQSILQAASNVYNDSIRKSFVEQGHHLSGGWEDSINTTLEGDVAVGWAAYYGSIVNSGVAPSRIPFGGESTGAKTSRYIQGLFGYFQQRGLNDKDALSAAFATAKVQKREGMSTEASRSYSKTGERQRFMQAVDMGSTNEIVDNGMLEIITTNAKIGQDIYVDLNVNL